MGYRHNRQSTNMSSPACVSETSALSHRLKNLGIIKEGVLTIQFKDLNWLYL